MEVAKTQSQPQPQQPQQAPTNGTAPQPAQAASPPQTQGAIVQRAPLGFELANMDDAWRFAGMLSASALLPEALRGKKEDILVTILTGRDFALSPMQSLRLICVVDGKPYMYAALKLALVKKSAECVYFKCVETSVDRATFETERRGEGVTKLTFTMEEAKRAGLPDRGRDPSKNNWNKYPAAMLRWRAISQLCDLCYPDVIGGVGDRADLNEDVVDGGTAFLERVVPESVSPPPPPLSVQMAPQSTPAPEVKAEPDASPASTAAQPPAPEVVPEKPHAKIEDAEPDPIEVECAALRKALAEAKTRREAQGLIARITALPAAEKAELTRDYEARVRQLPAR